jgi:hypothetical protein
VPFIRIVLHFHEAANTPQDHRNRLRPGRDQLARRRFFQQPGWCPVE